MNCNQARDQFLDIANSGRVSAAPEVSTHLSACTDCAKLLQALQQTMSVMDEWTSPEPSPYFNTRLRARLAEVKREEATAARGVFGWLQKPAFGLPIWRPIAAGALAFALAVSVGLQNRSNVVKPNVGTTTEASAAVNDLQKLEKNQDLYSDFELLDDLKTSSSSTRTADKSSSAEL
jgi:anti-sigma factor RsiW